MHNYFLVHCLCNFNRIVHIMVQYYHTSQQLLLLALHFLMLKFVTSVQKDCILRRVCR